METRLLGTDGHKTSCCSESRKDVVTRLCVSVVVGAFSGGFGSALNSPLYDEEFNGWSVLAGAGFGLVSGLGFELLGLIPCYIKCCGNSGGKIPTWKKIGKISFCSLLGGPKRYCWQHIKPNVCKNLIYPTFAKITAGVSAAFSDDLAQWEWEPLEVQLVDICAGVGVGLFAQIMGSALHCALFSEEEE